MEKDDKGSTMFRMGVSGWMFLLVPAYPGCPGSKAVKRSLLLLSSSEEINQKSLSRLKYLGVKFHSLTHSMGGIFKYEFVANLPLSLLVKEF